MTASAIGLVIERTATAQAVPSSALTPQDAGQLNALILRLAKAPRRRAHKSAPMILTNPEQWDHEALSEILAYKPIPKQAWDSTDIGGPWLNLIRNALNAEIWSFKHPDFTLIEHQKAESADPAHFEDPAGAFSPADNSVAALMRRGVVFMSCHNAIWELAAMLIKADVNPDKLPHEALAADLTNHLVAGVVLIPGASATMPELQQAGFHYAK